MATQPEILCPSAFPEWDGARLFAVVGGTLMTGGFGSAKGKVWIQNDLVDRGATSRVTGAYFADGTQHLDYDTYQLHAAPDTESDFAFKGALRDDDDARYSLAAVRDCCSPEMRRSAPRSAALRTGSTANSIER